MNTGCRRITASGRPPPERSSNVGRGNVNERLHGERDQRITGEHDETAEERRGEEIHRPARGSIARTR